GRPARAGGDDACREARCAGTADRAAHRVRRVAFPVGDADPGADAVVRAQGGRHRRRAARVRQLDAARDDDVHPGAVRPDPAPHQRRLTKVDLRVGTAQLIALLLASVRTGAWMAVAPPFNGRTMPTPIKALLSVAISLPVIPHLVDSVPTVDSPQLIVSLVEQAVVGAALGFLTSLVFAAVQSAGALIDVFG